MSDRRRIRSLLQHRLPEALQSSPAAQALHPIVLITAGQSLYFTTVLSHSYFQHLKITSVKLFVPEPPPRWSLHWYFPGK